ncbi:hypothetical protein VB774_23360 [Pseudanabaena galeata UHCC 0370]|uniref:Uncharacterized protein n=1 Tax=Pseudanabaena galeata UHCC 0370 TaxID=3110310 RepID=A0ABU5TR19_9CYAN|nr:hypothetical protein [Pseudanabaena galeata]MEA5480585.1 hypothetical protein [Pseudanabaena galeata UHCC 0370]
MTHGNSDRFEKIDCWSDRLDTTNGIAHIHNGIQIFQFKILVRQTFHDEFYLCRPLIIMNMCNA